MVEQIKRLFTIMITALACLPFALVCAKANQDVIQSDSGKIKIYQNPLKEINFGATQIADISNYLKDYKLVNISLGANQEICLLTVNIAPEREVGPIATFPQSKTNSVHNYKVMIMTKDSTEEIEIPNESWNYHFVQPIDSNNNILLACARSHYYKDGSYDKNGRVFNKQGAFIRDLLLGDGIQNLQVSSQNTIWTSYFDEGVFGNYGWTNPVGSVGLRAWDFNGNEIYKYNNDGNHFISDCYALNVIDDNNVWFYFYTDFELARKQNDSISFYKPDISGSDGFIVYDKYVLFRGGYKKHNNYFLYKFGSKGLEFLGEVKLLNENGRSIETNYFDCRSSRMVLLSDNKLYLVDLKDLLANSFTIK
jgi:hypothetical protein